MFVFVASSLADALKSCQLSSRFGVVMGELTDLAIGEVDNEVGWN